MRKMKTAVLLWVSASLALAAQQRASPAEIKQAESEVPQLAAALELKPGMTVADIGAGFGATTLVLSKWIGPTGRIYATDIAPLGYPNYIVGRLAYRGESHGARSVTPTAGICEITKTYDCRHGETPRTG